MAHSSEIDRPLISGGHDSDDDHIGDRLLPLHARHLGLEDGAAAGLELLLRRHQQGQRPQQRRRGGIRSRQLQPVHPLSHKLRHHRRTPEGEAAMGADHHHPPVLDRALLLQQKDALGVKPPQNLGIRGRLGLQEHRRQIQLIRWRLKQPVQVVFPFLDHRRGEAPATDLRWQIALQRQDAIRVIVKQPIKELVTNVHGYRTKTGAWGDKVSPQMWYGSAQ